MGGRALGGLAEPRDGGFVLRNRWGPQGLGRGRRRTTEPRGGPDVARRALQARRPPQLAFPTPPPPQARGVSLSSQTGPAER